MERVHSWIALGAEFSIKLSFLPSPDLIFRHCSHPFYPSGGGKKTAHFAPNLVSDDGNSGGT